MLDERLCTISVFVLETTVFELSLEFVFASNHGSITDKAWRQPLRYKDTLAIWEEGQMSFIKQIMIKLVLQSETSDWRVVYKKYRRSEYCRISDTLLQGAKKVKETKI